MISRRIYNKRPIVDIALLAKTPTQVESLLHNLEQAPEDIGLYVKANKTEYICFKF